MNRGRQKFMEQCDLTEAQIAKAAGNAALVMVQIVLDHLIASGALSAQTAIAALEHGARQIASLKGPEHIAAHDLLMARAKNMREKKPN